MGGWVSNFLENFFHSLRRSSGVSLLSFQLLSTVAMNVFFRFVSSFKKEMILTESIFVCLKYAPFSTLRMTCMPTCHAVTGVWGRD